ncbi:hypothetical protein DFH09DRAFT_1274373, partial [Mycena vulgaris]
MSSAYFNNGYFDAGTTPESIPEATLDSESTENDHMQDIRLFAPSRSGCSTWSRSQAGTPELTQTSSSVGSTQPSDSNASSQLSDYVIPAIRIASPRFGYNALPGSIFDIDPANGFNPVKKFQRPGELTSIDEIFDDPDDGPPASQGSGSNGEDQSWVGSPSRTQQSSETGHSGSGDDERTPGHASPSGSRKRKASNGLPYHAAIVEKAPRKSHESGDMLCLDAEQTIQLGDLQQQLAVYRGSDCDSELNPASTENTLQSSTHIYHSGNFTDEPVPMIPIIQEWRQNDPAGCTLRGNQEEQERTLQTTSIDPVISTTRASSEPLQTAFSTKPEIREVPVKRSASATTTRDKLVKKSFGTTLKLSMPTGRILKRNRSGRQSINSNPTRTPILVETRAGPPLYDAASVATLVIYWPEDRDGELEGRTSGTAESNSTPKPSAGLEELTKYLPNGGTILSVYQPATSLAWLEENYDLPSSGIYATAKHSPALAIFGPHTDSDPKFAKVAQRLANKSGYPVAARLSADDPMSSDNGTGFQRGSCGPNLYSNEDEIGGEGPDQGASNRRFLGTGNRPGENDQNPSEPPELNRDLNAESDTTAVSDEGTGSNDGEKKLNGGGDPDDDGDDSDTDTSNDGYGGGDPDDDGDDSDADTSIDGDGGGDPDDDGGDPGADSSDEWDDWFKTYADENMPIDPNRPWAQQDMIRPQAEVHTKLQIKCLDDQQFKFRLDRSFAVLGFQAHRPASIFCTTNLDCGFSPLTPTQINKHIQATNAQHTITATVGLSGTVPAPTASAAYANGHSTTHSVEAVDNKPMPPYEIRCKPRESDMDRDGTSFESYTYSYAPRHDSLSVSAGDQPPVDV